MVARSYQALVADTESLLERALVILKTKLQVQILAILGGFFAFFKQSVLAQAFELGQWFSYENLVQFMYFYVQ